jgi:hypothetical protein
MEEFNLSHKIDDLGEIHFLHVKEFIKKLKEELFTEAINRNLPLNNLSLDRLPLEQIEKTINKLAGDKLI